jgi:phosphatidylglycerophosphatase A
LLSTTFRERETSGGSHGPAGESALTGVASEKLRFAELPVGGRKLVIFFATGAYLGYVPLAPGTAGSLLGALLWWEGFGPAWDRSPAACLVVFLILVAAGCVVAGKAEVIFEQPDSPHIVIDEVLGMIATMLSNPLRWTYLLIGFVLFRVFDIAKPFPAGLVERRVGGGKAVVLDDIVAAVYANLLLQLLGLVCRV